MTMIGGTTGERDADESDRALPFVGPLGVIVGWPLGLFRGSVDEKADRGAEDRAEEQQTSGGQQSARRPVTLDDAERARIDGENARIAEELSRRSAGTRSNSIAAELAALEKSLGNGQSAPPTAKPSQERVDRDHDGNPDLWSYRGADGNPTEELDENKDGRADRRLHYDSARRLSRTEEDLDFDGKMETFSHYEQGQLVRRRADTDADGQPDAWTFFREGEIARHEIDRDQDGFRDLVMAYEAGELTREEDDRNRDGRPDRINVFKSGELIERHDDLDFDGLSDITSYYEDGKLVRRSVSTDEAVQSWSDEIIQ